MNAYYTLIILHKSNFSDSCVRGVSMWIVPMSLRYPGFSFFRRGVPCAIPVGSLEITKKLQKKLPCVQVAWTTEVAAVAYYPKGLYKQENMQARVRIFRCSLARLLAVQTTSSQAGSEPMRRSTVTEFCAHGLKLHMNWQPRSQGSLYVTVTRVVIWSFDDIVKLILDYTENKYLLCFPATN